MIDPAALMIFASKYPIQYQQYRDIPEILSLLVTATDPSSDPTTGNWTDAHLQNQIQNTNYWKTHNQNQRKWDTLSATDPAEAQRVMGVASKAVTDTLARLGLTGTADVAAAMRDLYQVASNAMTPAQIADYLTVQYSGDPKLLSTQQGAKGEILKNMEDVRAMQSDYGMPNTPDANLWEAQNIVRGVQTLDGVRGDLAQQAKGLFAPEVGAAIDRGMTVKQWASPYLATASQNLEIGQDQIDLSDPKWQAFLKTPDQTKPGASRVMTQSEWQAKIRTDPTYGFDTTSTARQAAGTLATTIAQKFGAVG